MTNHVCKSWPHFFQAIKAGRKTHDLRQMDRDFKVGDKIELQEYDPFLGAYTGDTCLVEITYITSRETPCAFSSSVLPADYCILSLRIVEEIEGPEHWTAFTVTPKADLPTILKDWYSKS